MRMRNAVAPMSEPRFFACLSTGFSGSNVNRNQKISQAAPNVRMTGTTNSRLSANPESPRKSAMIERKPVPTTVSATASRRPMMSPMRVTTLPRILLMKDFSGTASSKSSCSWARTAAPRLPMNP